MTSIATSRERTNPLEPAAVLPAQLMPALHGASRLQPERRLMLAVLEDAVLAYQRFASATTRAGARAFLEAQSWIENDFSWPRMSVNQRRMKRIPRSWTSALTSSGVEGRS